MVNVSGNVINTPKILHRVYSDKELDKIRPWAIIKRKYLSGDLAHFSPHIGYISVKYAKLPFKSDK